jgi:hypothetical protein
MHFKGRADRVDIAEDGTLHVVDYKTGKPIGALAADPDQRGTKLQLPVYGAAARLRAGRPTAAVQADYWFVTSKHKFKRVGYSVTPAVLEQVGHTLGTVVAGIESGVFPPHPIALSTSWVKCRYCDPDALGVVELRRQWERKRGDPGLAVYAELAEPSESGAVDG